MPCKQGVRKKIIVDNLSQVSDTKSIGTIAKRDKDMRYIIMDRFNTVKGIEIDLATAQSKARRLNGYLIMRCA